MNLSAFFSNESAFGRLMTKCGTIIAINVLFALSCIPFFTVGAAAAAMYHCVFEMLGSKEPINPFKLYWQGLRKHFVRATLGWLAFAAIMALGFINLRVCAQWDGVARYMSAGVIAVMIVAVVTIVYLLPALAMFKGRLTELVKLSICAAVAHPLNTVMMVLLNVLPLVLVYIDEVNQPTYAFAGTFFAFGLIAYLIGKKILPQFRMYQEAEGGV